MLYRKGSLLLFTFMITQVSRCISLSMSSSSSIARNMSKTTPTRSINIHWFRQDLRLHDNPALSCTIEISKKDKTKNNGNQDSSINYNGIIPIYCFDPRFIGNHLTPFGSEKCGVLRAKFIIESVSNLRENLEKKGSGLVVAYGKSEDVLEQILKSLGKDLSPNGFVPNLVCQEEVASEELAVDKAVKRVLKSYQGSLQTVWGSTLYNPEDLPFYGGVKDMPDTFTPFRNKVEKNCKIGTPLSTPSKTDLSMPTNTELMNILKGASPNSIPNCSLSYMPTLEDLGYTSEEVNTATSSNTRGVMLFHGGETQALARVKDYIWDKDLLKVYFDTRNGMLGADYSTKFSPWLAHGCLSPRYIAQECRKYELERVANKSTYWVVFELLWRDFFKFFALKHGNSIFFLDGTLGREAHGSHPNSRRWGLNKKHLQAWKDGMTGYPLVDANMRELAASGFMSNRGRQNVASFLAIDMNTDWRYGADHFESLLLDYDIYSNWGNWCSAAGMTGGRLNRFNIVKQSKDYDAEGDYVRYWCPELSQLPNNLVHEPWKMNPAQQEQFGVRLGVDYPNPIVSPSAGVMNAPRGNEEKGGRGKGRTVRNNRTSDKRSDYNPNRGRGQRKDMKSLKTGTFDFNE